MLILAHAQRTPTQEMSLDPKHPNHPLAAWAGEQFSYSGTWSVDEALGTITHGVETCSHPGWIGTHLVRRVTFSDDDAVVTLSTVNQFSGGGHVLAWSRDPDKHL